MQKLIAGLAVAVMAVFAVAGSVQAADDADLFQEHPWTLSAGGGFITRDGKWAVENEGTPPDIDVENWPKDVIAGRDPQLERAVDEALKALAAAPPSRLKAEPPPPTWGRRPGR